MGNNKGMEVISEVQKLLESIPESQEILEGMRVGSIGPLEATQKLYELAMEAGHGNTLVSAYESMQESFNKDNPRVWMDHENGTRIVNPVMTSALMERASLDGDVPEFRVGPIPEDGKPAVPVLTMSLDAVYIGMQLDLAAEETNERIKQLVKSHSELVGAVVEEWEKNPNSTALAAAIDSLPPVPTGVMGYEEGKKAEPLSVRDIETKELAMVGEPERRRFTHQTLATTQGRISASMSIQENLKLELEEEGFSISKVELPEKFKTTWYINCWGIEDINSNWNPVRSAYQKMYVDIKKGCIKSNPISLKVFPISGIPDRKFGWTVIVGSEK